MALTNKLKTQIDLPVWEWTRVAPAVSSALSSSCTPDNSLFNTNNGRYIYYLIAATSFWRYDTWTDSYEQLASPLNAPATATTMRFAGAQGYFGRVISAGSNTITTGLPFGSSAKGYKIRIISGKGAGQERYITSIADPVVADYGAATAGATTSLTDTTKTWTSGYVSTTLNVNNWVGYTVRIILGTGLQQVRKILYNSTTVLTIGDVNKHPEDPWCHTTWTAPVAGTLYQIESSVITVDTAWDTQPDSTSRYVIQSGGIWMLSGAAATPFFTMQYYDILADVWYVKPTLSNMIAAAPTDMTLERVTENASLWDLGTATGSQSTSTVQDTSKNWTVNQWTNYYVFIVTGTGRGQISKITSNTSTTLTLTSTWSTAPDATSRYQIMGFDAGTATATSANTLTDSTKSWTTNQWTNFAVKIMSGTGSGQMRPIKSNTSTALTLYNGWNVQPDTTSVYTIQGDTNNMYFTWGGSSEVFVYRNSDVDQLSHGRILDAGVASIACALLCDSNHTIYEQSPIAISGLAGTTTITATTVNPHNLKVGQYVSIRGVTSAAADQYNVTGAVQIVTVPSTTTFTYTPSSAGTGTYAYLTALSTSLLSDASKDFRALANGGSNGAATITFPSNTPSNINGWYVSGTSIGAGAQVVSGAGTTTLTLSVNNTGAVSGNVITITAWAPSVTGAFSSGGAAGALTVTLTANTPSYISGWYASGTGVGIGAVVTAGAGTSTVTFSVVNTAQISGTITFSNPWGGSMLYYNSSAVTITTGVSTGQAMQITTNTGNSLSLLSAAGAAPAAGITRYIIAKQSVLGASNEGSSTTYYSGVATGGSTTTIVDANAFWTSAAGNSGSAQSTTITLGSPCPANITGWYLTAGTGVNVGAQVVSGAGTTTITVSVANSGAVSGSLTFCAWNSSALINKRVKFLSSGGVTQELAITAVTAATGTITFALATAPTANATSYSIISTPIRSTGSTLQWVYGLSDTAKRGKYLISARGGATVGIDRLDMTTDQWNLMYNIPAIETLTTGSMYAYDGANRLYFTKDVTQRIYYLDLSTNWIHGAGIYPYAAGTAIIGNRMEIFTTPDGLNYLWINRHANIECFRTLLFF